ncbi:MAG: apolipoprotein N-acyltransferase [Candidatus Aminicenantes bacterium]|nr:apolipoprotein N-acyltransferase [Candidatus Aminicenantes bacterium]
MAYGLAFPKAQIAFLAFGFLIPLLLLSEKQTKGRTFLIFFSSAFLYNLIILYWIPRVMVQYGGTTVALGITGLVCLVAFLSLFPGLAGVLIRQRIARGAGWWPVAWIPAIWVGKDLVIEKIISGFPWCLAGYSQYKNTYFIQVAEIGGIHLISFLIIVVNVLLYNFLKTKNRKFLLALLLAFLVIYGSGFWLLHQHDQSSRAISWHRAGIIQPNSNHDLVFNSMTIHKTLDELFAASAILKEQGAELVVWPEFTVPIYPLQNSNYQMRFTAFSERVVPLLAGFTDFQNFDNAFNSVMLFKGGTVEKYDKFHLTPFGEYVLFRRWLFFVKKITDQIGDFTPGKTLHNLNFAGHWLATPICYEIIFPELTRTLVARGAELIVTISNDSWFGKSSALYQHLAMAVFRSIENRRFLLRSTSNGISALVDPAGRIIYQSPLHQPDRFLVSFQYLKHKTFFTRCGYLFPYLCFILILLDWLGMIIKKTIKRFHQS